MKWWAFAVCVAGCVVLQTTIASRMAISAVRPDWMFVLVVFFGLYFRARDAYLAGWMLGFCADLASIERLGLFCVAYCLTAVVVNSIRDVVFLKNAVTHFVVTLAVGMMLQCGLVAYRVVLYSDSVAAWGPVMAEGVAVALYTALWAPLIAHFLLKGSGLLGLHTSRYTHRGAGRAGGERV